MSVLKSLPLISRFTGFPAGGPSEFFSTENKRALYLYDFGDDWNHDVRLEKILPRKPDTNYPICLAGNRACPPEDCGGTWGYEDTLRILADPDHD